MEFKQIFKDGKTLMYKLQYREKVRCINVKVDKNNDVVVTAPKGTSITFINEFVLKHFNKLYTFVENREQFTLIDLNKNFVYIKGNKYNLIVKPTSGRQKYEILGNNIYLFLKDEDNKEKMVAKIFDEQGSEYIKSMAANLARKYKFRVPGGFHTKWYKSKWGQCEVKTGTITFATQLIMFNDEIIEYVIVHELCHLIHANHSPEFWDLVGSFYPKYKWAREKLKFQV